jgi:LacI family transcriptional regulator
MKKGRIKAANRFPENVVALNMLKLKDIAARAGISLTTVSFVLNDKPSGAVRISDTTRLKVLEAAEGMGYRHNRLARAIRTGDSRTLGVIGADLSRHTSAAWLLEPLRPRMLGATR